MIYYCGMHKLRAPGEKINDGYSFSKRKVISREEADGYPIRAPAYLLMVRRTVYIDSGYKDDTGNSQKIWDVYWTYDRIIWKESVMSIEKNKTSPDTYINIETYLAFKVEAVAQIEMVFKMI